MVFEQAPRFLNFPKNRTDFTCMEIWGWIKVENHPFACFFSTSLPRLSLLTFDAVNFVASGHLAAARNKRCTSAYTYARSFHTTVFAISTCYSALKLFQKGQGLLASLVWSNLLHSYFSSCVVRLRCPGGFGWAPPSSLSTLKGAARNGSADLHGPIPP